MNCLKLSEQKISKDIAAVKLKEALKNKMGELRWTARTQFHLDLSDLTDREIIQIVYKACDLYLGETQGLKPFDFKFSYEKDSPA